MDEAGANGEPPAREGRREGRGRMKPEARTGGYSGRFVVFRALSQSLFSVAMNGMARVSSAVCLSSQTLKFAC